MNATPAILITGWAVPADILGAFGAALDRPLTVFDICDKQSALAQEPFASQVQQIINTQSAPPLLIGWSTGALLALDVATQCDIPLAGIIALSGTACFCKRADNAFGQAPEAVESLRKGVLADARRLRTLTRFYRESAYPDRLRAPWRDQLEQAAAVLDGAALASGLDYLRKTDLRDQLQRVTAPTLFIHGANDTIIPITAAQWATEQIASAELHTLPRAGHLLPLLHHAEVVERVQQFVQESLQ